MENYNERLAEIMMRGDDKTYRGTAMAVKNSPTDVYAFYLKYGMIPKLSDPNANMFVMRKSIKQLEKELKEEELNEKSRDLTSLIFA